MLLGILLQGFAAGSLGAVGIWRNWISSTVAVKWRAAIGIGEVGKLDIVVVSLLGNATGKTERI